MPYVNAIPLICKATPSYTPHPQPRLLSTWIMASSGSNGGHDPGHAGGQFGQSLTRVGALTQAFAVAIQEATTPRNDSQVRGRRTVGTGSIGPPTDTPSHQW